MESSEKSQFGRPIAHTSEFATCSRTVRRQESFASGSDEDEERSLKLALVDNPIKIGRVEDSNSITCGNWKKRAMLRSAEWSDAQSATCGDNVLCKVEPDAPPTPSAAASMLTGPVAVETTVVRRHRRKPPAGVRLTCRVCGDDACGYNFDALTCHSCKLFFRRNAYRTLSCPFSGNCQMDKRSRKFCASCRLRKCFSVGMLRELIKLRYVQKNYHHRLNSGTSTSGHGNGNAAMAIESSKPGDALDDSHADDERPQSRFTPPDTPESACANDSDSDQPTQASERKRAFSLDTAQPGSYNAYAHLQNGGEENNASETKRRRAEDELHAQQQAPPAAITQQFLEAVRGMLHGVTPSSIADSRSQALSLMEQSVGRLQGQSLVNALGRLPAPSPYSYSAAFDEFGSPLSMAASSLSSASSLGTRCSSALTPRTRSVLSEYEYDTMLLQCHSCWHSLSQTMLESDVFAQISDKSTLADQLECGPTTVSVEMHGKQQTFTYFELGVRRAIAALRLVNDFGELPADVQMKLLKTALLSVLNVISVCLYDYSKQEWTINLTREKSQSFSAADAMIYFENASSNEVNEYFSRLASFHAALRQRFADDHVPLVTMAFIHLFEPTRFADDSAQLVSQLRKLQYKHVSFLRKYIHRHYRTAPPNNSGPCCANGEAKNKSCGGEECYARELLHFCLEQLNTTVRGLDTVAQQISNQMLVPNAARSVSESD